MLHQAQSHFHPDGEDETLRRALDFVDQAEAILENDETTELRSKIEAALNMKGGEIRSPNPVPSESVDKASGTNLRVIQTIDGVDVYATDDVIAPFPNISPLRKRFINVSEETWNLVANYVYRSTLDRSASRNDVITLLAALEESDPTHLEVIEFAAFHFSNLGEPERAIQLAERFLKLSGEEEKDEAVRRGRELMEELRRSMTEVVGLVDAASAEFAAGEVERANTSIQRSLKLLPTYQKAIDLRKAIGERLLEPSPENLIETPSRASGDQPPAND
ncbi:MAG: hypothetical protein R3F11_04985 [Verrucomicrobiales bacterium]